MPAVNDTILLELAKMYPGSSPEALADAYNKLQKAREIIESGSRQTYDIQATALNAGSDQNLSSESKSEKIEYCKEDFKIKPEDSIKEDKIFCCICGYKYDKSLKSHLLKKHKLTDKEYRELCGFSKDTKLYPKNYSNTFAERLEKARAKRAENLAAKKPEEGSATDKK